MTFRLLETASAELVEAQTYYESREAGLGLEFHEAVVTAIQNIVADPNRSPHISHNAQRYLMTRFPYGIIYQHRKTEVLFVSIFHLSRKPNSWRKNLER